MQEIEDTAFELVKGANLDPLEKKQLDGDEKQQIIRYRSAVKNKFNQLFQDFGQELSRQTKVKITEEHITKVLNEAQKLGQSYCLEYVIKRRAALMKFAFDNMEKDKKNGFKYFEYLMGFIDGKKELGDRTTVKKKVKLSEIIQ